MILKRAGGKTDDGLFRGALESLTQPAAIVDADGRARFANAELLRANGCGEVCGNIGAKPCEGCPMDCGLTGARLVQIGGRAFERTVSRFQAERGENYAILWNDITADAESAAALKRQYDKMRRDIFHARDIQASLLPRELAKAEGYVFRSLYKPSEEMSGDIFDLIRIGRDNVAFYIADVAGHGVTAAMLTIFFSVAVRVEMRPTDMPGKVLSRVHSRFLELRLEEQNYITAFLGRLELSTGRLYWSNAGHICPPLLMNAAGGVSALEMPGLPISRWFDAQEYGTASGQMEPGGRLVLFSDGLEAQWHGAGPAEDLNGAVGRIMRESAPEDCLDEIWRTAGAGRARGRHSDDATMLLIGRAIGSESEERTF
jgi:sigma-B regulation protein RsbU (phosphoserine phosphatase)